MPVTSKFNPRPTDNIQDEDSLVIKGKYIKMINRNARRLLQLVNQVLDLSKIDQREMQLSPSKGHLIGHLHSIVAPFSSLAEKENISFTYALPSEIPDALFDSDKLETIITNLLSNAFKFSACYHTDAIQSQLHGK